MDPNLLRAQVEKREADNMKNVDEIAKDQIENTKEFQNKFADKVDPFGKNKKKNTIKMNKIKFAAPEPGQEQSLGRMKQANLPDA